MALAQETVLCITNAHRCNKKEELKIERNYNNDKGGNNRKDERTETTDINQLNLQKLNQDLFCFFLSISYVKWSVSVAET